MRRVVASLVLAVGSVSLAVAAQPGATTITVPPGSSVDFRVSNIIVPQASRGRAITIQPGITAIEMASVEAEVDMRESVATTTLRITVKNPSYNVQEAEMLIPVPHGAAIRSFGFDGPGQEPTAKVLPRDEARRIYEERGWPRAFPLSVDPPDHRKYRSLVDPFFLGRQLQAGDR